jgi:cell division GTPase FtsZ
MCALQTTFGLKPGQVPLKFEIYGCGGAGCNMIASWNLPSVAVGTSASELERCARSRKILIPTDILSGFADADPSVLSLEMLPKTITSEISENDVSIQVAGLGGFAGSLGSKLISSISKFTSKFNISVVSLPFSVESIVRREVASVSLASLRKRSDMTISFENDGLTKLAPTMAMDKAFKLMNAIMERPIIDLSKVMSENDIPMMRQIAKHSGDYKLGVGLGRGPMRDVEATKESLQSPWFDTERENYTSAFLIISSYPIDLKEVNGIVRDIQAALPNARLMFGNYEDPLLGDKIRVTLLLGKPLLGVE